MDQRELSLVGTKMDRKEIKVLLTGVSSFTGVHFAEALCTSGCQVIAPFRKNLREYSGIKAKRIKGLPPLIKVENAPVGSPAFLKSIEAHRPQVYAHHGFDTSGYNNTDFPTVTRVAENLLNIEKVCLTLSNNGCQGILYSDSIFSGMGALVEGGTAPFSEYGEAKKRISDALKQQCDYLGLAYWRFVIPNPIGTLDNPKLLHHLFQTWLRGQTFSIHTPTLVRDHIPVGLLAKLFTKVCWTVSAGEGGSSNPSGWICSVEELIKRAGVAFTEATGMDSDFVVDEHKSEQPTCLINTQTVWANKFEWTEKSFWDDLIDEAKRQKTSD